MGIITDLEQMKETLETVKDCVCENICIYRHMAFSTNKDVDDAEKYLERYCEECEMLRLMNK